MPAAWRQLRLEYENVFLLMIGPAEPQDPVPAEILQELRTDPRVVIVDFAQNEDMPLYYRIMDLVILPTYREGFPNVALEAAAMELPSFSHFVLPDAWMRWLMESQAHLCLLVIPGPWQMPCGCISMTMQNEKRTEKRGGSVHSRIFAPKRCGRRNIRNISGSLVKRVFPFPVLKCEHE